MPLGILADLLVVLHLGYIGFVLLGGLLLFKWPRVAWLHIPAAAWGAAVELAGWFCPLTLLEHQLRTAAGRSADSAGFIDQYVLPLVYPAGLTRQVQLAMGAAVIALNGLIYATAFTRRARRKRKGDADEHRPAAG